MPLRTYQTREWLPSIWMCDQWQWKWNCNHHYTARVPPNQCGDEKNGAQGWELAAVAGGRGGESWPAGSGGKCATRRWCRWQVLSRQYMSKWEKVQSVGASFLVTQMIFKSCFLCFSDSIVLSYCWQLESADSDRNSVFCQAPKLTDPERFFISFFWHHAEDETVWRGRAEKGDGLVSTRGSHQRRLRKG